MNRSRWMAWSVVLAAGAFVSAGSLGGSSAFGQERPTFKTLILPDAIRFVQVFSEDRQVGTMIFDNFVQGTQLAGTLPSVETKKFSYVLHPESKGEACVVQHIRGYVSVVGGGSAALWIHSGGQSTLVNLEKAVEAARGGEKSPRTELLARGKKVARDAGLTVDGRPDRSDDFFVEIKRHVPVGKPLQTTIVGLVDHLDANGAAALHIDSIDFEVFPVVKPAK